MTAALAETLLETDRPGCPPDAPLSGRLGSHARNHLVATVGMPWQRRLARAALLVPRIRYHEQRFGKLSDTELLSQANLLRGRSREGDKSNSFIAEGFGLSSVAVWRGLGLRPYDVQLAAGVVMYRGGLVELATGEGKTLTAAFPTFLYGLAAKGVHVVTVNDYLASRDAELMGPVYRAMGLSVGIIQMKMEDAERTAAYKCDVTYGTASEFGFDFLRDRLKVRGGQVSMSPFWSPWSEAGETQKTDSRVQRGHYSRLVDEADSIFVDEARTPLIISAPTRMASPPEAKIYYWADEVVKKMKDGEHFRIDHKKDKVELTEAGRTMVRYSNPPTGQHTHIVDKLFETIEKGVQARYRFVRDGHYMVIKDKVVIVDESTGRPMPDRHWREGLHQAVEAKEGVPIHLASDHAAQITYQNYFRLYENLSGMSGTLEQNWRELRRVYRKWVIKVPTNRPCIRVEPKDQVFPTEEAKFDAIVKVVVDMQAKKRPVLIGTRSVEKSDALSARLKAAGVQHQVLNARQNEAEAHIIAQAGRLANVTVATNMAGRGTDIVLGGNFTHLFQAMRSDLKLPEAVKNMQIAKMQAGWKELHDQVVQAGGLHVIGTERHEAARIDRQLMGRAARQGDPGSAQFFLSLEDKLLEGLGPRRQERIEEIARAGGKRNWNVFRKLFLIAQRRTERKHYRQRLDMMHYDRQRREMLADLGADPYVD